MNPFWKSRQGLLSVCMIVLAAAAFAAWRMESRSTAQQERATQERIQQGVKDSIGKSTSGVKMCPLSDPDCNKR